MKDSQLRLALTEFCRDEHGATAIEYAMIGAMISIVVIGLVTQIGEEVYDLFESLLEQM